MSEETPEETTASKMHAKLKKLDVKFKDKWYCVLAGKPTSLPNRRIYLLSARDEKCDYSLWLAEPNDDGQKMDFWPYKCSDTERLELLKELLEEFIATAFD